MAAGLLAATAADCAEAAALVPSHQSLLYDRLPEAMRIADFEMGDELGEGSFGTVYRCTQNTTGKRFAVKVLTIAQVVRQKYGMQQVMTEKRALIELDDHPGIVKLHYTFKDDDHLYLVLEHATGGALFDEITRLGSCHVSCARWLTAELVNALEYIHSKRIIHRDLKPENILLDDVGHIKLIDFGSARLLDSEEAFDPFVGTAEYLAPEVLRDEGACEASDLWALGCIVYQLLSGAPPFQVVGSPHLTMELIKTLDYSRPQSLEEMPETARRMVLALLHPNQAERLGAPTAGGYVALKVSRTTGRAMGALACRWAAHASETQRDAAKGAMAVQPLALSAASARFRSVASAPLRTLASRAPSFASRCLCAAATPSPPPFASWLAARALSLSHSLSLSLSLSHALSLSLSHTHTRTHAHTPSLTHTRATTHAHTPTRVPVPVRTVPRLLLLRRPAHRFQRAHLCDAAAARAPPTATVHHRRRRDGAQRPASAAWAAATCRPRPPTRVASRRPMGADPAHRALRATHPRLTRSQAPPSLSQAAPTDLG